MRTIRYNNETSGTPRVAQKGTDRSNLFGKAAFAGIGKNIERQLAETVDAAGDDRRQQSLIHPANKPTPGARKMVTIVRHVLLGGCGSLAAKTAVTEK